MFKVWDLTRKEFELFVEILTKEKTVDYFLDDMIEFRQKMKQENPQFIKDYNWFFKEVWLYPQPIKRDTEVMRGVIVKKLRKDRNGDIYYVTLAEDGKLYVDNDECVMGENRETIATYLHELREDLIAGGDIE